MFNHEMNVQRDFRASCKSPAEIDAQSEIGDIMTVHDIEMQPVGPGAPGAFGFLAQTGKIGGEQ